MKVFAYILTFYLLALSFVPCNDAFIVQDEENHSISIHLEQSSHEHGGGATDCCTPFCQCNCCQLHVIDLGSNFLPLHRIDEFNLHQFIHFDNLEKGFLASLLRPPQV